MVVVDCAGYPPDSGFERKSVSALCFPFALGEGSTMRTEARRLRFPDCFVESCLLTVVGVRPSGGRDESLGSMTLDSVSSLMSDNGLAGCEGSIAGRVGCPQPWYR